MEPPETGRHLCSKPRALAGGGLGSGQVVPVVRLRRVKEEEGKVVGRVRLSASTESQAASGTSRRRWTATSADSTGAEGTAGEEGQQGYNPATSCTRGLGGRTDRAQQCRSPGPSKFIWTHAPSEPHRP